MTIDGNHINADISDIIEEIRLHTPYFQGKVIDSGYDLMVQCPYHKDGQERKPSMGIRKLDGTCHCLACGKTASLYEMIGHCFNENINFGYKWLTNNFVKFGVNNREPITLNCSRDNILDKLDAPVYVSEEELDKYRYIHPYMYERGLTDEVIELFDIGYDKETDSITFPVRELHGNCVFVARRSVKYKHFNIPKEKCLYGYYEVVQRALELGGKRLDKVYICEGNFDMLRFWCVGKYAVCGFGCLYSALQLFEISQLPTRTLVLALDNDKAGKEGAERIKHYVRDKIIKRVILPKGRKDPGECTDEELKNLEEYL